MTVDDLNPRRQILTKEQQANLQKLSDALTGFEQAYGSSLIVTSGIRSYQAQMRIDPEHPDSAHCTGEAVDVRDRDGKVYDFCLSNIDLLVRLELYVEKPTLHWVPHCHMQTRPTHERFFTA